VLANVLRFHFWIIFCLSGWLLPNFQLSPEMAFGPRVSHTHTHPYKRPFSNGLFVVKHLSVPDPSPKKPVWPSPLTLCHFGLLLCNRKSRCCCWRIRTHTHTYIQTVVTHTSALIPVHMHAHTH